MARSKAFGPLLRGTLMTGACVVVVVVAVRLWLWCLGEPGTLRFNPEPNVVALLPRVMTGDQGSRVEAIRSLGDALRGLVPGEASARAMAALGEVLRDPDATVRTAAAESLGGLGPSARTATGGLTAAMDDVDIDVRVAAALALLKVGGEGQAAALLVLARMVADPEPISDRRGVILAMQSVGQPGKDAAALALASLLANEDGTAREDAVRCVSALEDGETRLRPTLDVMLKSADLAVRYHAAAAAIEAHRDVTNTDLRVVAILADVVTDASFSLTERRNALEALSLARPEVLRGQGTSSATHTARSHLPSTLRRCGLVLSRQLESRDVDVRLAAATLLHMIDPDSLAGKDETDPDDGSGR